MHFKDATSSRKSKQEPPVAKPTQNESQTHQATAVHDYTSRFSVWDLTIYIEV
jgi:hypothetical protein